MRHLFVLALVVLVFQFGFAQQNEKNPSYKNPKLCSEERVADLLKRMTLEEKVVQMAQTSAFSLLDEKEKTLILPGRVLELAKRGGAGTLESCWGYDVKDMAHIYNQIQKTVVEKSRLGIPVLMIAESLHGLLNGGATVFPQACALGCTWNPELVGQMAKVIGQEAKSIGVRQVLAPDLDLAREPRWGRFEESYGEDPYLVGRFGVAYVKNVQNENKNKTQLDVATTLKHFMGHGSPQNGINLSPVDGNENDLRSLYLPPFKAAITEANARAVMPAYSEYMGVPLHGNKLILDQILRKELNFKGYVFSDYGGIDMMNWMHHVSPSNKEAALLSVSVGVDLEAPGNECYKHLAELVEEGRLSEDVINTSVARILKLKFDLGLFENPYCDEKKVAAIAHKKESQKLAYVLATESVVLLKNNNKILPLSSSVKSIAVVGPNADQIQFGDYSWTRSTDFGVTVLEGLKSRMAGKVALNYAKGCDIWKNDTTGFAQARQMAAKSDIIVAVLGGTSSLLSGIGWGNDKAEDLKPNCGEGFDRNDLNLSWVQDAFIREMKKTGKPVVVIMVDGRPNTIPWIKENCEAVLQAYYPGEEGGNAIADILTGTVNPSGRLSATIPYSTGHIPCYYNYKTSARGACYKQPGTPEKPGRDYVYSSPKALWPFGYGLSYTQFEYSDLKIQEDSISATDSVKIELTIKNTGKVDGKETVQLYLQDIYSSITTPIHSLKRFEKVFLKAGESKNVHFNLSPEDMSLWNIEIKQVVELGDFEVQIGTSADSIKMKKKITII
jgi:beta-glucosidase